MLVTTPVLDTLRFSVNTNIEGEIKWLQEFKEKIGTLPNIEDFRDTHFICVENKADNHPLQACYGVTLAMNEIQKNPKAKIILYGVLPLEYVRKRKPEIDVALKYDNVRHIDMPFTIEELSKVFQKPKEVSFAYTVSDETKKYLSAIFHGIRYIPNWDQPEAEQHPLFERSMRDAREYFPSLAGSSNAEIIEFLKSVSDSREEVMKGVRLSGVYCDVEGTILVDGQLNQKVVAKLQEFEQQGKTVCLWTDGDVEHLKKDLESLGISYEVKSKFDHAGAIAEVIIDDQDEYIFSARTKISAEKFIRVSDLI